MKAAIYARISDDRDDTRLGIERQLKDCRVKAQENGWQIVDEYVDNDVSAYKGRVRPSYCRMLDDIASGVVEAVVVYHLDRLHRQPRELEQFFDICDKAGVQDLASVTGDVDLSTDDGRFMARIQGAVARKSSDDMSRRIRRKALEIAQAGKIGGGGTRPFGYERDFKTIVLSEAAIVQEAAGRVLAGESVRSICLDLVERKIPTATGGKWSQQVMTRMLKSARISGKRQHQGEIIGDAEWPGIISAEEGDRLRVILGDPARRTTNGRARKYLLAGMLRCGRCGEPLISRPRADGRRRYVCARRPETSCCGKLGVVADELEALVAEMVIFRLEGPDLARALSARGGSEEADHQKAVDAAAGQLEELAATWADGEITKPEWLAARAPIEARLSKAKQALARTSGTGAVVEYIGRASTLADAWGELPFSRRRAILAAVIDHITIAPGRVGYNRFDPDRVAPTWTV